MACIIVADGPDLGRYFILGDQEVIVGRDPQATFALLDHRASRNHLQICFEPEARAYVVLDLGSSNGTFINGARLEAQAPLVERDQLLVGATRLVYSDASPSDQEQARRILAEALPGSS